MEAAAESMGLFQFVPLKVARSSDVSAFGTDVVDLDLITSEHNFLHEETVPPKRATFRIETDRNGPETGLEVD